MTAANLSTAHPRRSQRLLAELGGIALIGALALSIVAGTSPLSLALAGLATVLLATHPSLGPLGAAVLVVLALPYDRAANGYLPRIASVPIRPQDVAIAVGVLLALGTVRLHRPRLGIGAILLLVLLTGALAALAVGLIAGNEMRDILRDLRWWLLYGAGLLLTVMPSRARPQVVRGVLGGALVFSTLMIAAAVLPEFPGGIRARAVEFDFGLLRLQYGNSVFVLFLLAWATRAWLYGRPRALGALGIGMTAAMLSLTRMLLGAATLTVGLGVLHALLGLIPSRMRLAGGRDVLGRLAAVAAVSIAAFVVAIALSVMPPLPTPDLAWLSGSGTATDGPAPTPAEDPLDRISFQSEGSGVSAIVGGRFRTYERAAEVIARQPFTGAGLGATIIAEYKFGGEPFATPGRLPNVDDAYLTIGMKGGVLAGLALLGFLLWPLFAGLPTALRGQRRGWWVAAWLAMLVLTVTQSFATTGYGPFVLGLAAIVFGRGYARRRFSAARAHE